MIIKEEENNQSDVLGVFILRNLNRLDSDTCDEHLVSKTVCKFFRTTITELLPK